MTFKANRALPALLAILALAAPALAFDGATAQKMLQQVKPSLVAVKFTWKSELRSEDQTTSGIIISEDGQVMTAPGSAAYIPDGQMKNFKIIVPSDTEDETEIDAELDGRDERAGLMFIHATAKQQWTPVKFLDHPVDVGDTVYSVGILPKSAGYKAFVCEAMVSARLRGPVPQILVDGNLAGAAAVVLNEKGEAIGNVHSEGSRGNMPEVFVPASYFLISLNDLPTADHPVRLSWFGCPQLKGIEKDVADSFGLKNKPCVQIGDVVADSPAARAGLTALDIIVTMDGKPLERGDLPEELPIILLHKIQRIKPGSTVTFGIIRHQGDAIKEIPVTLEEQPRPARSAKRFYASDLGFVAREAVFVDYYYRKMQIKDGGVVIALLREQAAAAAAKLQSGDMITELNGKPVTDLNSFKSDYQDFRKDHAKEPVVLVVTQLDGKEETINIEPPQDSAHGEP